MKILELVGFSERDKQLIANACNYAKNDPAGLPGHNLMLIISKLVNPLGQVQTRSLDDVIDQDFAELVDEVKLELVAYLEAENIPWIVIKAMTAIDSVMVWNFIVILWNFIMKRFNAGSNQ